MTSKGFIGHGRANRRKLLWLLLQYVVVIEALAAMIMTFILAIVDPASIPFVDPVAYGVRYAAPVALVSLGIFAFIYTGHSKDIVRKLDVVVLAGSNDPQARRYLGIADPVATMAGLRRPSFGLIHSGALDAFSVGSSRTAGLIVVTSGLLDALDDDEIAGIVAHQAMHIRNGDTEIAAANFALTRTAINLQVNNPLRVEDWRQVLLILALPFLLPALLAGGAMTMLAMFLARRSRRGIALSRDTIADAEAIRITHYPEALMSAIRRTAGRGGFEGSADLHGLLFSEGGATPRDCVAHALDRIGLIQEVAGDLMAPGRTRTDTRPQRRLFGIQPAPAPAKNWATTENDDAFALHPPSLGLLLTDTAEYRRLYRRFTDHWEWTGEEARNIFGLTPKAVAPLAVAIAFLVGLHWPSDGNYARAARIFDPTQLISLVGLQSDTFSSTGTTPDQSGGLNLFPDLSPESKKKQGYLLVIIVLGIGAAAQIPGLREHVSPRYRVQQTPKAAPEAPARPRVPSRPLSPLSRQNTSFENRIEQRMRELQLDASTGDLPPDRAERALQAREASVEAASHAADRSFAGARRTFGNRQS